MIRESFAGAWQQSVVIDRTPTTLLAFSAVYACVTGIASDIAKMCINLTRNNGGIWEEIEDIHGNSSLIAIMKVLERPNDYQNRIQFITCWILSKLMYGNTYVLKQRSGKDIVKMYVLHPLYVTPLIAEDGSVYYSLHQDYLAEVSTGMTVPASEIFHDRMPELWHPLLGVSPLYACAMSVTMGNKIQSNSTAFFANGSIPGGVVTVPGEISQETADRLKDAWTTNYGGVNSGKVAILGDGMKFDVIRMQADQSQLIDQLKWTVSDVARAFHYPEFKLGGTLPPYAGNVQALITSYYVDCLQTLIESLELCMDEGLKLPADIGIELDTEALLRMDTAALYDTITKSGDWMKLNEQRKRANLQPLPIGGDTVYKQEQDHSIEALAKRDSQPDPFGTAKPATPAATPATPPPPTPTEGRDMSEQEIRVRFAELTAA